MAATAIFCVHRKLNVDNDTFVYLFWKPAASLKLKGEIVADDELRYHFRVDGSMEAVKDLLAYVSIGAPAFGRLTDIELWDNVNESVTRGPEALLTRPNYLVHPPPTDDAVVPQRK